MLWWKCQQTERSLARWRCLAQPYNQHQPSATWCCFVGSIWATPGHAHSNVTIKPAADRAASASGRAEVLRGTTEGPAAGQEPDAEEGGCKADEPADDGTPPEVQAILRQRQHEAQTRRMWEQWLEQRLERQPWLLGGTGPSPGAVDTGCVFSSACCLAFSSGVGHACRS